jgi:hypothetical protein
VFDSETSRPQVNMLQGSTKKIVLPVPFPFLKCGIKRRAMRRPWIEGGGCVRLEMKEFD